MSRLPWQWERSPSAGGRRPVILFLVDALATFRLTRLVVEDQITAYQRAKVIEGAYRRAGEMGNACRIATETGHDVFTPDAWVDVVANDPDPPKLAYLVTCPWCSSAYIAVGVVVLRRLFPRWWGPVAEGLALSAAAGLLSESVGS
jgi:hypothetical protein